MSTPFSNVNLTKQPPQSPRERFGGFVILGRTVDKCRASITGKLGAFHYDCPLDNQLFGFKGVNGGQFKKAVASAKTYEDVAAWLQGTGIPKTPEEIEAWSDKTEALKVKDLPTFRTPEKQKQLAESCRKAGVDFETATLFDWLEADDEMSFEAQLAAK